MCNGELDLQPPPTNPVMNFSRPVVSAIDQTKILDMLCRYISPIRNKGMMPDGRDQSSFHLQPDDLRQGSKSMCLASGLEHPDL